MNVRLCIFVSLAAVLSLAGNARAASAAYQQAVLAGDPALYYQLNETTGNAVNHGQLGAAFDGVYTGAITRTVATAGGDTGVRFDDATAFIQSLGIAPAGFTGNPAFSIEAIVQFPAEAVIQAYPPFLNWGASNREVFFGFDNNARNLFAGFYNAGLRTNGTLSPARWVHLVMTRAAGGDSVTGTRVFIDGVETALVHTLELSTPDVPASVFRINRSASDSRYFTGGSIDEVALYPRVLSEGEIASHYTAFAPALPDPVTPLQQAILTSAPLVHYRLNETSGTILNYGSLRSQLDATATPSVTRGVASPGGDKGVSFASADDFIDSLSSVPAALTGNPAFTIEAVVFIPRDATTKLWPPFLHWGGGGTIHELYFSLQHDDRRRLYAGFYNSGLRTAINIPLGGWMHIAMVREAGGNASAGTTIYINGLEVPPGTGS